MHRNTPAGKHVVNDVVPLFCRPFDESSSVLVKYIDLRQCKILFRKFVHYWIYFNGGNVDAEFVQRFRRNPNSEATISAKLDGFYMIKARSCIRGRSTSRIASWSRNAL